MTKSRLLRTFQHIPTLATPRLTLRRLSPSDAQDMFEYASQPLVTEYLLWCPHEDVEQTRRYLEALQTSYKHGEFFDWALEHSESGKMIGTCGFTSFDHEHRRAEVGYVLNPYYWGHGLASEAVLAVTEFAFRELNMNRVEAHFMEGNTRSRHVMERCGMTYEGMLQQYMFIKGDYRNIGICAVTRDRFSFQGCYAHVPSGHWLSRFFE
ncbi:MAG: GNAT family N-acetyltransferase [Ruminococcaceae bacterium]|nr:GNAT family N-acetyltransferase [Oscillospiraceae bacterium]